MVDRKGCHGLGGLKVLYEGEILQYSNGCYGMGSGKGNGGVWVTVEGSFDESGGK